MLFLQTFMNNLVLSKGSCLKRHAIECTGAIVNLSCTYATQKAPPTLTPPPQPPPMHCKLASDWLGVGLELRSFCYWTSTKIGNQRIDNLLLSNYGRVQSAPLISESSLFSIMVSVYMSPIRPLAVG
jgi:hypothetical protein